MAQIPAIIAEKKMRWSSFVLFMAFRQSTTAFMLAAASRSSSASKTPTAIFRRSTSTSTMQSTTTAAKTAYDELVSTLQTITNLQQSNSVLKYDQLVFMPQSKQASAARGAQLASLASVIHEKSTDSKLGALIEQAEKEIVNNDDREQMHVVKLAREDYDKKTRIPKEVEEKRALLSSTAYAAWVEARQNNAFADFAPLLKECFDISKETAAAIRKDPSQSLYSVLLDEFERGMPTERIDEIFDQIEQALVPLLSRVLNSEVKPTKNCLQGTFDVKTQQELGQKIVKALGFDDDKGRIDVSVHPFTSSLGPADVRITSRFSDDEWYQGLAGSIHEAGHAMYEQNLNDSSLPVDKYLSMGCHESQSLFWERHVSLSKAFWKYATPQLNEAFGTDWTNEDLYQAVNIVEPGLIRVTADELTYPLHVILRYRIERDIIADKLDISDIPTTWNTMMKDLLDVDVPNDTEGCLQDVHWSSLAIGYFPTYLIGSATAAQLAHYCQRDFPDFESKIENGEFAEIKAWLTEKVHRHGRRYDSLDALLEEQMGEKLNPKYFIDYLTTKYTDLYQG